MAWGDVKKIIFKSYKAAFKKYFPFLTGYGILPYEVYRLWFIRDNACEQRDERLFLLPIENYKKERRERDGKASGLPYQQGDQTEPG